MQPSSLTSFVSSDDASAAALDGWTESLVFLASTSISSLASNMEADCSILANATDKMELGRFRGRTVEEKERGKKGDEMPGSSANTSRSSSARHMPLKELSSWAGSSLMRLAIFCVCASSSFALLAASWAWRSSSVRLSIRAWASSLSRSLKIEIGTLSLQHYSAKSYGKCYDSCSRFSSSPSCCLSADES